MSNPDPGRSLMTTCHVTHALHAVGLATGALGAMTEIGSFLFGWPSSIAVIIKEVKRGDARGTLVESHFARQTQTFRLALAWAVGFVAVGAWTIYRIEKG